MKVPFKKLTERTMARSALRAVFILLCREGFSFYGQFGGRVGYKSRQ